MKKTSKGQGFRHAMAGIVILTAFFFVATFLVMGIQCFLESRPKPTPAARATPTLYPTPPFPDGQKTPIPAWPLIEVSPSSVPITERSPSRLARPDSPGNLPGSNSIRTIVSHDEVLWMGTDGGLLRWNPSTLVFDRITTADGLGSNQVNGVAVAPDGTVWAATTSGLSRYAPSRAGAPDWTNYTPRTTDGGLADDQVVAVVLDAEGRVWAGTPRGLSRFAPNPKGLDGSWQTLTTAEMPKVSVRALQVDEQDTLWVATELGLFRAEGDELHAEEAEGLLQAAPVAALGQDSAGRLWVATDRGTLLRRETPRTTWTVIPEGAGRPTGRVRALATSNAPGRMWLAATGGLGRFHQFERSGAVWQTLVTPEAVAAPEIRALALDEDGVLWVGTSEGLFRYWEVWDQAADSPVPSWHRYYGIAFDDRGDLWVPHELWRFDGRTWTSLAADEAQAVADVRNKVIGVTGDGASGIWVIHDREIALSHFEGARWQGFTPPTDELWPFQGRTPMADDGQGGLWVGGSRLVHVTWQEGQEQVHWQIIKDVKPGWGSIHDIAVDNLGNVWLATEKWGLLRYSGQAWIAYPELLGLGAKGGPIPASAVALDARGRLWVAGGERVARFDGRTWQVRTVVGGTHFVNISQFIPDPGGGTWAIHRDEMLSYLDDDSWWTYTQADGLPSQIYEGAQHPLTGRLWLSTEAGLVRFDGPSWEHLRLDAP